jgi:hypothetical protein
LSAAAAVVRQQEAMHDALFVTSDQKGPACAAGNGLEVASQVGHVVRMAVPAPAQCQQLGLACLL